VAVMLAWPAAQKPKAASPALTAAASAPEFTTAETTRELLGTQQGEVRFEKDRGLVREMRANYLEHVAWTDPYTRRRVEIAVPREDVYFQPVAMQ
jgi:hypothetical protein